MRGRPLPQMTPARPGDTVRPFVCSRGTWSKMGKWSVAIPDPNIRTQLQREYEPGGYES
jgi:hypothetical protein